MLAVRSSLKCRETKFLGQGQEAKISRVGGLEEGSSKRGLFSVDFAWVFGVLKLEYW